MNTHIFDNFGSYRWTPHKKPKKGKRVSRWVLSAIAALILLSSSAAGALIAYSIPPEDFPRGAMVRIPSGATISEIADTLADEGVIRSPLMYKLYVRLLRGDVGVQAGNYLFDVPQSVLRVAYRTVHSMEGTDRIKVTIPEGSSSREIAAIVKKAIPAFDDEAFLVLGEKNEGYLFPETYFLDEDVTPEQLVREMRGQFDKQMAEVMKTIEASPHTLQEVIVMASIIEEEANNTEDRRKISGVLWKRIEIDMPLQVDAPFYYLFGKGSSQLTLSDLATTSPYNTYKNKGLPPHAISNPGLGSILAALNPIPSDYLYYLADKTGVTHYAKTHDEHVANKAKYLQ